MASILIGARKARARRALSRAFAPSQAEGQPRSDSTQSPGPRAPPASELLTRPKPGAAAPQAGVTAQPGGAEAASQAPAPRAWRSTLLTGAEHARAGSSDLLPGAKELRATSSPAGLSTQVNVTVKVNLLSASGLTPSLFVQAPPPLAVVSVPSSGQHPIALASCAVSDGYVAWDQEATFSLPGRAGLDTCSKTSSCDVLASHQICPGAVGASEKKRSFRQHSFGRSRSGRRIAPLLTDEADASPDVADVMPCPNARQHVACPPAEDRVAYVDLYSSPDRTRHLGRAVIPLHTALHVPGTPCLGTHKLKRKGFLGMRRADACIRAVVTVESLDA